MKILITGANGFIGSHFVRHTLRFYPYVNIRAFARNTNQRNKHRLTVTERNEIEMIYGDLNGDLSGLLEGVDVVVNFAAKTFVDQSVKEPKAFVESNVLGTFHLLEQVRKYEPKLYVQISTDEVYGATEDGAFLEDARIAPTNPYAATKASADALVLSYASTYGLPCLITRTENNYGRFQHPQKVIPTFVRAAINDKPLPVYGDGKHRRTWLHVNDHCAAIWALIEKDACGIYHIGAGDELENIQLARRVLRILGKPEDLVEFIDDGKIRPSHDRRYAIDSGKLRALGWRPVQSLEAGLADVVKWYDSNWEWLR